MLSGGLSELRLDGDLLQHVAQQPSSYIVTALLLVLITVVSTTSYGTKKSNIPFFGGDLETRKKRWMGDCFNLLREGYAKYPDKPFQVWTTDGDQIVVPPKFVDELKMQPDTALPSVLSELFQAKHTTLGGPPEKQHTVEAMIKTELPKNLPKVFPGLKEELDYSFPLEFPTCKDWTPVKVHGTVVRIISRLSGRAFVSSSLQRNEEWIDIYINFPKYIFDAAMDLRKWRSSIRWAAKYFVPSVRKVWDYNDKATNLLKPIIAERVRDENKEDYVKPNDCVEWFRGYISDAEKQDIKYQAIIQLGIGAAAVHTTSQLVTNAILNLAGYPEYIPMLREEAERVLKNVHSEWSVDQMAQLKKMDSFIKESQRFGGSSPIVFQRRVLKTLTLSDGTVLPKGAMILAASDAISHSAAVNDDPLKFDGLRYYARRQQPGEEHKHQLVSIGPTQMHFGAGRHACPGRWLASHETKLILASLVMRYDIKLKDGETERPKNFVFQTINTPNPMAEIMFKERKT